MTKILTSLDRYIDLPLKAIKLKKDEQVVATDAPFGILMVEKTENGEILKEYNSDFNSEKYTPIGLPSIDQYLKEKNQRKEDLLLILKNKKD